MHQICECVVSEQQLNTRIEQFVPEREPFFFRDDDLLQRLLSVGVVVYTREEFFDEFPTFAVDYGTQYNLWSIHRDAHVLCTDRALLDRLEPSLLLRLFEQQVRLGRGQVYSETWLDQLVVAAQGKDLLMRQVEPGFVTLDGNRSFVLTRERWVSLHDVTRQAWVMRCLLESVVEETEGEPVEWDGQKCLDPSLRERIERIACSFPADSGANCFASAISLTIADEGNAKDVRNRWLPQVHFIDCSVHKVTKNSPPCATSTKRVRSRQRTCLCGKMQRVMLFTPPLRWEEGGSSTRWGKIGISRGGFCHCVTCSITPGRSQAADVLASIASCNGRNGVIIVFCNRHVRNFFYYLFGSR